MGHSHGAHTHVQGKYLGWAIALNLLLVVVQVIAGISANSLALLADSAHNLLDVVALFTAWLAIRIATRKSTAHRTFGFHRVGILAALANALTLIASSSLLSFEAVKRLQHPEDVQAFWVILVALFAVGANGLSAWWLWSSAKHDMNIRGAFLHLAGDAVSSLGVVVTGFVIALTGWSLADPITSILISALILWSSWGLLRDSINVLLEGSPPDLDMQALECALRALPGVKDVHDLHVWTIGSGRVAGTCHLVTEDQSLRKAQEIQRSAREMLSERFGIGHATIQIEVDSCGTADLYCDLKEARQVHEHGLDCDDHEDHGDHDVHDHHDHEGHGDRGHDHATH